MLLMLLPQSASCWQYANIQAVVCTLLPFSPAASVASCTAGSTTKHMLAPAYAPPRKLCPFGVRNLGYAGRYANQDCHSTTSYA